MTSLTWQEFQTHLAECHVLLVTPEAFAPEVVIRDTVGDRGIAAVHLDKGRLVFDIGKDRR
jgi:hypothetical protein